MSLDLFVKIVITLLILLIVELLLFIKYEKAFAVVSIIIFVFVIATVSFLFVRDISSTNSTIWVFEFAYDIEHALISRDGKHYTFSIKMKPEDFFDELQNDFEKTSIFEDKIIIEVDNLAFSIVYEKKDIRGFRYTLRSAPIENE